MQKLKPSQSLTNLTSFDSTRLSASTTEYKWFKSAVREAHSTIVPPSDDRVKLGNFAVRVSNGFCISLSVIDGLKSTAGQVFSQATTQVRLQLSLFDSECKQFLGRTWIGPEISYKEGGKLTYNQTVYFHSSLNDPGILLVFEIVALIEAGDGQKQAVGCGWGFHKIFKPDVKTVDLSDNSPAPAKRIEIYHGSPRALLYINEDIEGNAKLVRAGYQVLCAIQVHRLLLKAIHLFPENVIVGQREAIPGLIGGQKDPKSGVIDNLKRPRLAKAWQCSLERITVRLNPSLEKFEDELRRQVLDDYVLRAQPSSTGKGIQVTKRFLRVGVHNGWTFVAQPEEIQLSPSSESVNLNKSASFKRGHQRSASTGVAISAATGLVHKSRVDIEGLLQDKMFHVVFSLVYEVTVPSNERADINAQKTSLAQPVLDIVVCWGAVSPLASAEDSSLLTVQLFGGNLANPDSTFVFRGGCGNAVTDSNANLSKVSSSAPSGTVTFTFNRGPEIISSDQRYSDVHQQQPQLTQVPSHSLVSLATEDGDLLRESKGKRGKPPIAVSARSGSKRDLQQSYEPQGYPLPYLPFPSSYMHGMLMSARDTVGMSTEMHELPYTPIHFPILATCPGMHSGQALSRAAYAKLLSVGFPPILNRSGTAAEAVDPSDFLNFVMAKEDMDRLKINEITLQFMAFSRLRGFEPHAGSKHPSTVFFTFQFYRFEQVTSERLLLGVLENDLSGDKDSLPFILQRFDKDGTLLKGPPGYQVKYVVDPVYMRDGEGQLFAKYLAEQTLHIDVWDGDSLLLIGSSIVELRHLCRQGREAVQVSYELDVITTEYIEQEMVAAGDVTRDGSVMPTEVNTLVKGRLHLRLGNVGHPLDSKLGKTKAHKNKVLLSKDEKSKFAGGSLFGRQNGCKQLYKTRICKAQHLADISQELAQLIRTRKTKSSSAEDSQSLPAEKLKKLSRMEAVRVAEKLEDTAPTLPFRKEKDERYRDLKTIELFRTHNKREDIINMLNLAITTEHVIYASLGTTEFFEFVLKNPYNVEIVVSIEWTDIDLEVITNPIEWRHFKMVNEIHTPLEEGMFNMESKSGRPEIFLRAKESVHVPFKLLTFKADHSVEPPTPSDPHKQFHQHENLTSKNHEQHHSRVIKVFFRNPELKPLAILSVKVEHQPHIIDQTFRLSHPEQTFLKKSFRLPPLHSFTDLPVGGPPVSQVFVRCSDCNVICETRKVQPGEPHDIFMKVACGASPQVKRFYMAIYVDPYLSSPIQIWQVYVQAMQRVDMSAIQGQTSRFTLVLRGTQTSRLVQCFTSHPLEMQLQPKDAFVLPANSVQEMHVGVRPVQVGCKNVFINVVDTEFHQLIRSWLVTIISRHPVINKSFELMLPVGGGKGSNKKISFKNPYGVRKVFFVRTNRDDLLHLKEQRLELGPAETASIGLRFCPSMAPGYTEILVFINDEDDKNEETFCVKATYQ